MSEPRDDPPVSKSLVNRVGTRLRKAAEAREGFSERDLELLDQYRLWHQPTLEQVHGEVVATFRDLAGIDEHAVPITSRPLKTPQAIIAKLVRSKTRLSTMQDIAGTRVTVPSLEIQRAATDLVLTLFDDRHARVDRDTVERADEYGYRAIHVVATLDGRHAEIQIRTRAQDAWAQVVEELDRALGSDLKHGQGRDEWLEWLILLSDALRERDLGRPVPLPPNPYDALVESPEGSDE